MIRYPCALCSEPMESPQSQAGHTERCPNCGLGNVVPPESTSPDKATAARLLRDAGGADLMDLATEEVKQDRERSRCDRLDQGFETALTRSNPPEPSHQDRPSLQRPGPPRRTGRATSSRPAAAEPVREDDSTGLFFSRSLLILVILVMMWIPTYRICRAFAEAKAASVLSPRAENIPVDTPRP